MPAALIEDRVVGELPPDRLIVECLHPDLRAVATAMCTLDIPPSFTSRMCESPAIVLTDTLGHSWLVGCALGQWYAGPVDLTGDATEVADAQAAINLVARWSRGVLRLVHGHYVTPPMARKAVDLKAVAT